MSPLPSLPCGTVMPDEPALTSNNQRYTPAWWDEYYLGRANGAVRLALGDHPHRPQSYLDHLVEEGDNDWREVIPTRPPVLVRQVAVSPESLRAEFIAYGLSRLWEQEETERRYLRQMHYLTRVWNAAMGRPRDFSLFEERENGGQPSVRLIISEEARHERNAYENRRLRRGREYVFGLLRNEAQEAVEV